MRTAISWLSLPLVLSLSSAVLAQDPEDEEEPIAAPKRTAPAQDETRSPTRAAEDDAAPADTVAEEEAGSDSEPATAAPAPGATTTGTAPLASGTEASATGTAPTAVEGDVALGAEAPDATGADGDGDVRELMQLHLGPLSLAPVILLRAHATPYVGDDALFQAGDIAERGGFRLRYARLGFDASYDGQARLRVSTDLSSDDDGEAQIHDAYVAYTPFSFAQISAGAQTVPVGRSEQIRSGRAALIERPLATRSMAPGHQIGIIGRGELWDGALGYALGVFNGLQRTNLFYEGWDENYAPFGNRFDGLAYAARITSDPIEKLPNTAADEQQGKLRIGVGANYMYSDGGARDVHLGGGDVHLMWRGLHVLGEAMWMRTIPESDPTQPGALPFEITSYGMVGEAGYMIIAQMLGATARFEWIDPNSQSEDEADNWLITGGAHFHFVEQLLKAQVEYTHREERFGLSLKNDSVTISLQGQLDPARPRGKEAR